MQRFLRLSALLRLIARTGARIIPLSFSQKSERRTNILRARNARLDVVLHVERLYKRPTYRCFEQMKRISNFLLPSIAAISLRIPRILTNKISSAAYRIFYAIFQTCFSELAATFFDQGVHSPSRAHLAEGNRSRDHDA